MKRSVAIHGSTPPFVRWAIWHQCPLRTLDPENLADQTFRQLRGLREWSIGIEEGRVFENVCVHPDASLDDPEAAQGFLDREVFDAFGSESAIRECCDACPANAMRGHRDGIWAGCYGWIPGDLEFDLETILRGQQPQNDPTIDSQNDKSASRLTSEGMMEQFERAFNHLCTDDPGFLKSTEQVFPFTTPRWYGWWQSSELSSRQLLLLKRLAEQVVDNWDAKHFGAECPGGAECPSHLIQFRNALRRCAEHGLVMHVELVPAGHANGSTWTIAPHCPDCKYALRSTSQNKRPCPVCGRFGNPQNARKYKVLGIRPYSLLSRVIGKQKTIAAIKGVKYRFGGIGNPPST